MLWKEANLVNSTHSRVLFWIVFALLLLGEGLFALTVASNRGHAERDPIAHLTLVTIEAGILLILVAVNAAVCVVTEREQGTLDLVHATLITPGEIVAAKIAGTLRSVAFLLAIPFLHLLLAHVVADVPGRAILAYFAILTVFLFLFTVTGVRFSVISKRPGRAVVRSIGLLGILVVGVPVVLGLLAAISGRGEDALLTLLASNPMSLIFYPAACMVRHGVSEPQYTTATGFWAIAYPIAAVALAASLPGTYARRRKALEGGPA
jgi:ABC-type transport system involved in multi-copper enzyme maturation permease subunit